MESSGSTPISNRERTDELGQSCVFGLFHLVSRQELGRDVDVSPGALKVLPEVFAQDQQRMACFAREAQVLASLNHPNIASIYGLEETEGKQALVLELVEGEDLAERIKRGAIPLEESLKIALQIAEALEAAHEKGIIHRDLKPANVKITPEGTAKVLDFGLAKAMEEEVVPEDISQSPTISQLGTKAGIILGTAAYMSPEQAKGKPVDKPTDLWAFGAVLFEMLTGQRAFAGDDASEILASVIKVDIDWNKLPKEIPSGIEKWLRRCLQSNPKQRLQDMGDFRLEIEEYLSDPSAYQVGVILASQPPFWKRALPWSVALALSAVAGAAIWSAAISSPPSEQPVRRFVLNLPSDHQLMVEDRPSIALSPDSTHLVYAAHGSGRLQLYLRALDRFEVKPIAGSRPLISPSPTRGL